MSPAAVEPVSPLAARIVAALEHQGTPKTGADLLEQVAQNLVTTAVTLRQLAELWRAE